MSSANIYMVRERLTLKEIVGDARHKDRPFEKACFEPGIKI
jgi:hypothetical protein